MWVVVIATIAAEGFTLGFTPGFARVVVVMMTIASDWLCIRFVLLTAYAGRLHRGGRIRVDDECRQPHHHRRRPWTIICSAFDFRLP